MGYTRDQLEAMGAKPVSTGAPSAAPKKSMTLQELQAAGAKPVSANAVPAPQPEKTGMQKAAGVADALFGFGKVGDAIGTQIARMRATEDEKQYIEDGPTMRQIAGSAVQGLINFTPVGKIAKGIKAVATASKMGRAAGTIGNVGAGGATGYAYDVASGNAQGEEDPTKAGVGTAIGTAIPLVPPVLRGVGRLASEGLGVSTGVGRGAIKEGLRASAEGGEQAKAFKDAMRGDIAADEVVDEARNALGQIVNNRRASYQDSLGKLAVKTKEYTREAIKPVVEAFNKQLNDFGVTFDDMGKLDFERAPGLGRYEKDLMGLSRTLQNWGSRDGDLTIVGIDKLKQVIDDFRIGSADSRKFDAFVTNLRNQAKKIIKNEPEYDRMVKNYEDSTGLIKEIQRGLSLGDKAQTDTAFRKLTGALRVNNEFRKQLVDEINEITGGTLTPKIAGQQMSEVLPRGLIRPIGAITGFAGAASGIGIIPLLQAALFTSPRLVGEILRILGIGAKKSKQIMEIIAPQGVKFPGDMLMETKPGQQLEKSIIESAKNPAMGMSIRDVSKKVAGATPAKLEDSFKNFEDLSTKLLGKLEGRSTVSKQFISDLTNSPDLKQAEKDLFRKLLAEEEGTIKVKDFADKVKSELLPLNTRALGSTKMGAEEPSRFENVSLPSEIRGPVADYGERIYESPIKTSAGNVHFGDNTENYFAHTRVEDLADNAIMHKSPTTGKTLVVKQSSAGGKNEMNTRRVIEIQSDLFQKGRLEQETRKVQDIEASRLGSSKEVKAKNDRIKREAEIAKLEPYRNTWHERVIREEVKQAAKDGKTRLQFPTGETAMKIEGLVNRADKWVTLDNEIIDGTNIQRGDIITYQDHDRLPHPDRRFFVTKNNGNGTFKAVDSMTAENDSDFFELLKKKDALDDGRVPTLEELVNTGNLDDESMAYLDKISEQLSAQDVIDKENQIYKFYEKDIGKYVKNKYDARLVTDKQGVTWWELDVPKERARMPVEAFGLAPIGVSLAEQNNNKKEQ